MLSRAAESFFWIGRYIERAEYTARYTNVKFHLMQEISTREDQQADSCDRIRLLFLHNCKRVYQAFHFSL